MKKKRTAATGSFLLKNSPFVVEGEFYKPETVLSVIAEQRKVDKGIIEIIGPKFGGRIGVKNNTVITDAVVEETGETGTSAVCRLLLMPHGIYTFRVAVPTDQLVYDQELNLSFDEAKKFLAGPSSIGLAVPGKQTLNNLKALTKEGEFSEPGGSQRLHPLVENEDLEYVSPDIRSEFQDHHEYKKLVETVDKKRKETIEIIQKEKQTQTNLEALKAPGPLPSRKEKLKIDKNLVTVGGILFIGVIVACTFINVMFNPHKAENAVATIKDVTTAVTQDPNATAEQGPATAPYELPTGNNQPVEPPANYGGNADKEDEELIVQPVAPDVSQTIAPPTSTQLGDEEIARWSEAVRQKPSDAAARRELAQAYLLKGDTTNSIDQFYNVMKLRKVESSEIISYANNLMVFGNQELAKQFLVNILRSDPSRKAIRERLAELR